MYSQTFNISTGEQFLPKPVQYWSFYIIFFLQNFSLEDHHTFPSMHSLASKVSKATSIMAETFTSEDEVTSTLEHKETTVIPSGKPW